MSNRNLNIFVALLLTFAFLSVPLTLFVCADANEETAVSADEFANEALKERLERLYPDPEVGLPAEFCRQFVMENVEFAPTAFSKPIESSQPEEDQEVCTISLEKVIMDALFYKQVRLSHSVNASALVYVSMSIERAFGTALYGDEFDREDEAYERLVQSWLPALQE